MKFSACFQDDGIIDSLLILRLRHQRVGLVCFTLISVEMGKFACGILDLPDAYRYSLCISPQYHFNFRFYLYLRPAFFEPMETLLQRNKHTNICAILFVFAFKLFEMVLLGTLFCTVYFF